MSEHLKTKTYRALPEHEVAYLDICSLVNRHADKLDAAQLLAVAANMVGKLVAMQDQRKYTPQMAMAIVADNIAHGNAAMVAELHKSKGTG